MSRNIPPIQADISVPKDTSKTLTRCLNLSIPNSSSLRQGLRPSLTCMVLCRNSTSVEQSTSVHLSDNWQDTKSGKSGGFTSKGQSSEKKT